MSECSEERAEVKENAKERGNERQKLARLVGNAWNVRTHSRMAFCVYVYVRIYIYTCARLRQISTVLRGRPRGGPRRRS